MFGPKPKLPISRTSVAPATHAVRPVSETLDDVYVKLGVRNGFDPLPPERARWLWFGLKGTGKTTLQMWRPRTLILDLEDTARSVPVPAGYADYVYVPTLQHALKLLERLKQDAQRGHRNWDHVVFDPIDRLIDLLVDEESPQGDNEVLLLSHGKGYTKISGKLASLLLPIYKWGYGWSCTLHLQWTIVVDEHKQEVEKLKPTAAASIVRPLKHEADYLCQLAWATRRIQVPDAKNPKLQRTQAERGIVLKTQTSTKEKASAELSYRIPLSNLLPVPPRDCWSAVQHDWEQHVTQLRSEL